MNKFLTHLCLLGIVLIINHSIFAEDEQFAAYVSASGTSTTSEKQKVDKNPVIKARMAFIGNESDKGLVLQLEEGNLVPQQGMIEKIRKTTTTKGMMRTKTITGEGALDAYKHVLSPLLNGETIVITKQNIKACKNNLNDDAALQRMADYFKGEGKEAVKKRLAKALETFYGKIEQEFFNEKSGIDYGSLGEASVGNVTQGFNELDKKYANLNQFFMQTLARDATDEDYQNFLRGVAAHIQQGAITFFDPFTNMPKVSRAELVSNWIYLWQDLANCKNNTSGTIFKQAAAINMTPFMNISRDTVVTRPLRLVYMALEALGREFKFEMDPIAPMMMQQAAKLQPPVEVTPPTMMQRIQQQAPAAKKYFRDFYNKWIWSRGGVYQNSGATK